MAVQIPFDPEIIGYTILIEIFLLVYQTGMSLMLISKLKRKSELLYIHFISSLVYLSLIIGLGVMSPGWMDQFWVIALFVFPWVLIILFLVTIDDLERVRHYR